MAKKKLSPIRQEYNKEYKKLQQRVKSAKAKGWDVSSFQMPKYQESGSHLGKRIEELKELKRSYLYHFFTPPSDYEGRFKSNTSKWSEWINVINVDSPFRISVLPDDPYYRTEKQIRVKTNKYGEIIERQQRHIIRNLDDDTITVLKQEPITEETFEQNLERIKAQTELPELETDDIEEVEEIDDQDLSYDDREDYDDEYYEDYEREYAKSTDITVFNIFDLIERKIDDIKDSREYRTKYQYYKKKSGRMIYTAGYRERLRETLHERIRIAKSNGTTEALADYLYDNYEALQAAFEAIDYYLNSEDAAQTAYLQALEILKGGNLTDEEREEIEDYTSGFESAEGYDE